MDIVARRAGAKPDKGRRRSASTPNGTGVYLLAPHEVTEVTQTSFPGCESLRPDAMKIVAEAILSKAETNSLALLLELRASDSPLHRVQLHPGIVAIAS